MDLATFWFIVLGVLWTGYFVLEGFDFGVGMLLPVLGGKRYAADAEDAEKRRRLLINTIGPVWDGNEVWVLTAGGATFAAFPNWYATLFSGFYLPLLLILVALIVRNLGFEYRHKRPGAQWKARWDQAIFWGSLVPALLWGVALTNIVRGVPIDAKMEFTGNLFTLLNPLSLLGGVVFVALFLTHGAIFVALKTDGNIRYEARLIAQRVGIVAAGLAVVLLVWIGLARRQARVVADHRRGGGRPAGRHRGQPGRTRGLGLHGHGRHHRPGGRDVLHRALPQRHAVEHQPGLQPDDRERIQHGLHPQGDDDRGAHLHADRPDLPGLDVLGLPEALDHQRDSGRRATRSGFPLSGPIATSPSEART